MTVGTTDLVFQMNTVLDLKVISILYLYQLTKSSTDKFIKSFDKLKLMCKDVFYAVWNPIPDQ